MKPRRQHNMQKRKPEHEVIRQRYANRKRVTLGDTPRNVVSLRTINQQMAGLAMVA